MDNNRLLDLTGCASEESSQCETDDKENLKDHVANNQLTHLKTLCKLESILLETKLEKSIDSFDQMLPSHWYERLDSIDFDYLLKCTCYKKSKLISSESDQNDDKQINSNESKETVQSSSCPKPNRTSWKMVKKMGHILISLTNFYFQTGGVKLTDDDLDLQTSRVSEPIRISFLNFLSQKLDEMAIMDASESSINGHPRGWAILILSMQYERYHTYTHETTWELCPYWDYANYMEINSKFWKLCFANANVRSHVSSIEFGMLSIHRKWCYDHIGSYSYSTSGVGPIWFRYDKVNNEPEYVIKVSELVWRSNILKRLFFECCTPHSISVGKGCRNCTINPNIQSVFGQHSKLLTEMTSLNKKIVNIYEGRAPELIDTYGGLLPPFEILLSYKCDSLRSDWDNWQNIFSLIADAIVTCLFIHKRALTMSQLRNILTKSSQELFLSVPANYYSHNVDKSRQKNSEKRARHLETSMMHYFAHMYCPEILKFLCLMGYVEEIPHNQTRLNQFLTS